MTSSKIRKAVIPAAGLGTRFLPATKVVPKEMLPIAGRPLIQFAVEEAAAAGLETVILVVNGRKSLVAGHFDRDPQLESLLAQTGKRKEERLVRRLSELAEVRTTWQEQPLGLAHAIRCARPLVGDEPFAVILPDALIDSAVPCIRQLMECYEKHTGCIVATQLVAPSDVSRFGIVDVVPMSDTSCDGHAMRVTALTERPQLKPSTSRYGIFGRYILEPEIFLSIENTRPGFGGELQLTDALQLACGRVPIYAYRFEGVHYDAGSKLGFLQATLGYSLKDPELAGSLRDFLAGPALTVLESVR
jgi:UTP--glucose-1-phosphate uridylyltransferase